MTQTYGITLLLLATLSANSQDPPPANGYHTESKYDPGADTTTVKYNLIESARAEIGREDLRKLLNAKSLKAEWGGVEFKFSGAALASLKDFISRRIFAADTH